MLRNKYICKIYLNVIGFFKQEKVISIKNPKDKLRYFYFIIYYNIKLNIIIFIYNKTNKIVCYRQQALVKQLILWKIQ